jgi:hypothetical protein
VRLSTSSLFVLPSPVNGRVGIRDFTFEACSSFTHVAAYQIAARLKADICPEAPTQSVTRPSRSVATMLIDVYMDGSSPHWRSAPLRRTVNYRVGLFVRVPGTNTSSSRELTRCGPRLLCSRLRLSGLPMLGNSSVISEGGLATRMLQLGASWLPCTPGSRPSDSFGEPTFFFH